MGSPWAKRVSVQTGKFSQFYQFHSIPQIIVRRNAIGHDIAWLFLFLAQEVPLPLPATQTDETTQTNGWNHPNSHYHSHSDYLIIPVQYNPIHSVFSNGFMNSYYKGAYIILLFDIFLSGICDKPAWFSLFPKTHWSRAVQRNPAIAHFKGLVELMPYCERCLIANM